MSDSMDEQLQEADLGEGPGSYALVLGERLRNVRQQQGLSLHDVERESGGRLKASVVGAYERGERAVSVARLRVLADFYRVPIGGLLPGRSDAPPGRRIPVGGLRIDLTRLDQVVLPELSVIERFCDTIRTHRGDYNGRVLTIRDADLDALAAILDLGASDLRGRLVEAGVAASP